MSKPFLFGGEFTVLFLFGGQKQIYVFFIIIPGPILPLLAAIGRYWPIFIAIRYYSPLSRLGKASVS